MSFQYQGFEAATGIEPERALNFGLGVAQAPLWMAFYASAGLGAAWWWSTAWTRAVPALDFARLAAPEAAPVVVAAPVVEALIEAPQAAAEAAVEAARDEAAEAPEALEAVATVEAVEDSIEITGETAVESVSYTVEQVEAAIAEATDVAPEALVAAAGDVVAEPIEVAAPELPVEAEAFKPSKKKTPKSV